MKKDNTEESIVPRGSALRYRSNGSLFGLFVVFVLLRVTEVVDWSWWWVTAPLWGGFAIGITIGLFLPSVQVERRED